MKIPVVTLLALVMSLTGCSIHFYRVEPGSLHIYLKKPEARTVSFAYSKDGYQLHSAEKIDSKTWMITVPTNSEFSYFYIVDGAVFLPPCTYTEKDDFGSKNCIFVPGM